MAKFSLVDGDATILTSAFNALRAGMGTHLAAGTGLDGFLDAWKGSSSAFASEAGFIGLVIDGHPEGAATVVLCQFAAGAIDAELGDHLRKLSRELLRGFDLAVIRAASWSQMGDKLLTLSGYSQDGILRKLVPEENGVLRDVSMYSLTIDDLVVVEPANFVYSNDNEEIVRHETIEPRQEALPLGA